ncbi:hypothetical protein PSTG_19708, partial [Puccinia striiformis f. sp. tritici PST-78]
ANGQGIGCNSRNPADVVNFGLFVKEIRPLCPQADLPAAVGITGLIGADGGAATTTETALLTQNLNYMSVRHHDFLWARIICPDL